MSKREPTLWDLVIREVAEEFNENGVKFNFRNPYHMAVARERYFENINFNNALPGNKMKIPEGMLLYANRRKALNKNMNTGECEIFSPNWPEFWRDKSGKCITYEEHMKRYKKKPRKPRKKVAKKKVVKRKKRGGVLLGGDDACPYCGN